MSLLHTYLNRSSIRFRLFRLLVVVTVSALLISMAGGALFEWHNQQKQVRQSLATITDATGVAASAAVAFQDAVAARKALDILAAQKAIEAAALYPIEGKRLASYGNDEGLPNDARQMPAHLPSFSLLSPSTTSFQPIMLDDSPIGYIFIRASLRDYHHNYLLRIALVIGANLLALLLALALGLRFLNSITQPVKALADTSRQVREAKNFSLRATPPDASTNCDEIGELIVSFNAMLAEIEQREHTLNSYHDSLERRVAERTEALQAANLALWTAKDTAEEATVSKSRFLAAASHDLRQPIQAINLFKHALDMTALNEEQRRISDYLSRSIHSLGKLLDALLDISKLDAGVITPRPEAIAVLDLLGRIDAEFAPMATAKGLRFKFWFPLWEMTLFTDNKLLQSLLRNLIDNAIKYTRKGGVLVAIRRRGGQALVQVWDTGIAIGPEYLDSIFDEYFQVGNPERDKAKGLGLGLAIAKRQAKLLRTKIVCRSRLGRGSVFEFRLPLADKPPEKVSIPVEPGVAAPCLAGCHVVVIEDDSMVAKAIALSLKSHGMSTTTYGSAEEALADEGIAGADFYISDFRLPGKNGADLLDAIQARAKSPIKAVLLTGETSPDWIGLRQSARWTVLFKPLDMPKLLAAIGDRS
jgi:signal transduction histidine kinase